MKIFLDDVRTPPNGWTLARSVDTAKSLILDAVEVGIFDNISLDHDLGENTPSGYDLLCWMEERKYLPFWRPTVHSMNPVGREKMERVISKLYGDGVHIRDRK